MRTTIRNQSVSFLHVQPRAISDILHVRKSALHSLRIKVRNC